MKIAVFAPHHRAYSETFIANQIRFLPFLKLVFTGREFPFLMQPVNLSYRFLCFLFRSVRFFSGKNQSIFKRVYSVFLKWSGVKVCLVEFGTLAAKIYEIFDWANIPYVVHFHGYDAYHKPTLDLIIDDYKILFRRAFALVVVSKAMENQLLLLGAPEEKIIYNPYGVDQSFFVGGNPGGAPLHFVAVGRFVEKKAPHLLITSFRDVVLEFPDAKLTIVGDGPLLNPCRSLAKALGLSNNIAFSGIQSPVFIRDLLVSSRAFLQHSVASEEGDSEGMPLSIIEAQMVGLPVVSTLHAGIPDVVIHGSTGFLSDENDIQSMSSNILALAKNPELASEMGANARARAVDLFSLDSHISNLAAILEAALVSN